MRVEFDRSSLIVDGRRRLVRSAALHYYRLPGESLRREALERFRDAGLNAVTLPYAWNYHSQRRGDYDFAGDRDVDRLHDLIEEAGLFLIARPGPFVGGGIDLGGLPAWLLTEPDATLRCRDPAGYVESPAYLSAAREWFEQIVPRLAARPNLILVELEHGYRVPGEFARVTGPAADLALRWFGSPRLERWLLRRPFRRLLRPPADPPGSLGQTSGYMRSLVRWSRDLGVTVPLVHADSNPGAGRQTDVDLPAQIAAFAHPRRDWRGRPHRFDRALRDREGLERHAPDAPLLYAELQTHLPQPWGGEDAETLAGRIGAEGVDSMTKAALEQRACLWSYSLLCAGITPGYMSSPDAVTLHDGGAPVAAAGRPREAYAAIRELNRFLAPFESDLMQAGPVQARGEWCPQHLGTLEGSGRRFAFLRNDTGVPVRVPTPEAERSELGAWESQIRVYGPGRELEGVSPLPAAPAVRAGPPPLPELERWSLASASPQLDPAYDDEAWDEIPAERLERGRMDLDDLGLHYGFVWYRGTFAGPLDRLSFDARNCYAVWINGRLLAAGDLYRNPHGIGPDGARPASVTLSSVDFNPGRNALVILVESLGHPQGLADERGRRGLVAIDTGGTRIRWRYRGGLIRGERGITPQVAFESIERGPSQDVGLPYSWSGEPEGVAVFETPFELDGVDPSVHRLALSFDSGICKANLYANGHLLGRYWPERGPQRRFVLPWGILRAEAENQLAVVLWKRSDRAALGRLQLEVV
ncbi:MAG: beta-galactosidase [Proteobacteria bacterium]|nr:beta-galactosidase [Pseudomonadota bacterium]